LSKPLFSLKFFCDCVDWGKILVRKQRASRDFLKIHYSEKLFQLA